ncbi:hypothetical protein Mycch_1011 [Mycolicibacterium chubuense NBB4]|uniref:Uncharacterized protein n=1 Tax=Mycolicibacterium chubuense (strain NBB4) TaxID=710421 RepID=I4BEW4_MYCCN|nr:hypothetical protein [Mycolicibacterium chubuense]AFM15821.1 hypothetical protein Mycch_1011 [Mycolicibacterium chubuense NBB4]
MVPTDNMDRTEGKLDDLAWQFLRSEFTGDAYAMWPLDRRLDVFLRHHGYREIRDNGSTYGALLDRVMSRIHSAACFGGPPVEAEDAR